MVYRSIWRIAPLLVLGAFAISAPASAVEAHLFSLRFGGEVNETKVNEHNEAGNPHGITETEENICTAASGDKCESGVRGEAEGQLAEPHGIAVNEETGASYIVDRATNRVLEFSSLGSFVLEFGGGVNSKTGAGVCTAAEHEADPEVTCQRGTRGVGPGEFAEPWGIAVDNNGGVLHGDVFVADNENDRVEVFTASGAYLESITGSETPSGGLAHPRSVAIDPGSGELYVADYTHNAVVAFQYSADQAKWVYVSGSQIATAQTDHPLGVAVDGEGDLYVASASTKEVSKFSNTGVFEYTLAGNEAESVAVDVATNDVFVGKKAPGEIRVYGGSSADLVDEFGSQITGEDSFVAVDSLTGAVLDAEESKYDVDVFTADSSVPGVVTEGATAVDETGATLNGSIETFGFASSYWFEYGTSEAYGEDAPATPASIGSTSGRVSQTLTNLAPNTTYYYRLVGEAGYGPQHGAKATFKTLAPPPTITTEPSADVTHTSAMLAGAVNSEGARTEYRFVYIAASECTGGLGAVEKGECGMSMVPSSTGVAEASEPDKPATAVLTGLAPISVYYWDIVASNGTTVYGPAQELVLLPAVQTLGVGEVSDTTSTVYGAVDPPDANTTYRFEYGTSEAYGASLPLRAAETGAVSGFRDVSAELTDLEPGLTYHFRIVASTTSGSAYGDDETFTTPSASTEAYPVAPGAITGATSSITSSSAELTGVVAPRGSNSSYYFEYGSTAYYGAIAPSAAASTGTETTSTSVAQEVTGLVPATTYHYRLVASNAGGSAYGEDKTFTTGLAPTLPTATSPPTSVAATHSTKPKTKTNAQKLHEALKRCHKLESKRSRARCERTARRRYSHSANNKTNRTKSAKGGKK